MAWPEHRLHGTAGVYWVPAFAGMTRQLLRVTKRNERENLLGLYSREPIGGTLYIGVTSDLVQRVYEHRTGAVPGFTSKYGVYRLVYFEEFGDIENAIKREKRLKKWNRGWKIRLIEELNPNWDDLFPTIATG